MALLNLLQWREQSLWQRYRAVHCFGMLFLLAISFFAAQWVITYSEYLERLQQQVTEQARALNDHKRQKQRWRAYQQYQDTQRSFHARKQAHERLLSAFYALLDKTQQDFHSRKFSLSQSQLELAASYQQVEHVNELYVWLEDQLIHPGLKYQLLPEQGALFRYVRHQDGVDHRG